MPLSPEDIIAKAIALAKTAPKELQDSVFKTTVDLLTSEQGDAGPKSKTARRQQRGSPTSQSEQGSNAEKLVRELDSTAHPEIHDAPRVYEQALFLLRAAKDQCDIDGLTGSEIATILTDKFRLGVTRQAVSQAFKNSGRHLNATKSGRTTVFRIMAPGEKYLDEGKFSSPTTQADRGGARKPKATKKQQHKAKRQKADSSLTKKAGRAKPSRSTTPTSEVDRLLGAGFFKKPQSIESVMTHLRTSSGRTFNAAQIGTVLLRRLRSDVLKRSTNKDGTYEYVATDP